MKELKWVDPPSGWQYGFPKLLDVSGCESLGDLCVANGYPSKHAIIYLRAWGPTPEEVLKYEQQ